VFTAERSRVSALDELGEKLARFLSVDDTGERGVLALQTHAGMQHDGRQEARLPPCESEVGDGLDAAFELHQNVLRDSPDRTANLRSARSIRHDN
jgi:hypothetical protein